VAKLISAPQSLAQPSFRDKRFRQLSASGQYPLGQLNFQMRALEAGQTSAQNRVGPEEKSSIGRLTIQVDEDTIDARPVLRLSADSCAPNVPVVFAHPKFGARREQL
jgi:hypothetical protein